MKNITRVLRVLEYSADSIEAINYILEHHYSYDNEGQVDNSNPINGSMGGGGVVATCDPTTVKFIDGKYRLMRYLEYRSGDVEKYDKTLGRVRIFTGLERIIFTFEQSRVPIKGEKLIVENGYEVLIRSGIIGNGFGENVEVDGIDETNS